MDALTLAGEGASGAIEAFTFGDPESVLDRRELLLACECWHNHRWYEPPIRPADLARAYRVSPHHVGSSRVDLQACKLEYSIVSPK